MYKHFSISELVAFTKDLKVLYVEDNKEAQMAFVSLLDNFFTEIAVASNGEEGFKKFKEGEFDLIISDIRMPKLDGIGMSKKIREEDCTIPIIMATAHKESSYLLGCIEVGVSAYLLKPINFKQLKQVIKQTCEKIYYQKRTQEYEKSLETLVRVRTQELELAKTKLQKMANRDPMTNLYNRRYFYDVSETLFHIAQRDKGTFTILMIDIDKFKNVNDTYGHMLGDKVIRSLADTFRTLLRKSDLSIRFGGEEFIILLPNTAIDGGVVLAQKIRETVEQQKIPLENPQEGVVTFTVSIGAVEYDYEQDSSMNTLLQRVDKALYEAKDTGRNKVVAYQKRDKNG